ncbi:MAG: type IV secretory system conjugative DNA transfer family protein [Terriglobia bacterium]|nr:type IV secretory system conjugative DNA transfer family protein [Terriglobia bacterium]
MYPLLGLVFLWEALRYRATRISKMETAWPRPIPHVTRRQDERNLEEAHRRSSVLLGYDIFGEPFYWSDKTRTMQSNAFGMTGAGKTNLLETVTEQDIARGVPIIFIDGKGDKKLLSELLPSIEAAGRMPDLRIIDPMRPDISARYNPFWAPQGNAEEHVAFVFESFNMEKDFFEGHQRVYLENIARVLHYSGKRFNFHDVLVCAYDQSILKKQMKAALDRVDKDPAITGQQRLTLTMSVRNLLESFEDKERVSKIQGLINEMMTFMGDEMAMITGPYDDLLSLDDVIDKGLILFMSLNVNVNERAVTALGRMLLQNLQLMIGRRYSRAEEGQQQPFVSVIMDEFSPFAYENFAHILQTARGANVAFLFALQSAPQLLQVGRGFRNDVSSAPNTTFMLRTKDEETAKYFLNASARVRQMRRSMHVEKRGVFNTQFEEGMEGSQTEIKDTLAQDEHIKKMPVGQMEMLVTDPILGTIHKHLHIRKASSHWLSRVPMNVYPKLLTLASDTHGLNLAFPTPELEEKRQRRRKK